MSFNDFIEQKCTPILKGFGFDIAEQYNGLISFSSTKLVIRLSYNILDKEYLFQIGENMNSLYIVDDTLAKEVFDSEIKFNHLPYEVFIDNVILFLHDKLDYIKQNTLKIFSYLHHNLENRSEAYTANLVLQQKLEIANQAWNSSNYKEFIKIITDSNIDNLPTSYRLKYNIAKKKI